MRARRKAKKCKIRAEYILWLTLILVFLCIVTVNTIVFVQTEIKESKFGRSNEGFRRNLFLTTKEPLIDILHDAGVDDTAELRTRIPSWGEVIQRFGEEPKILGLGTCSAFRRNIPRSRRVLAPAGPFNSGTNLLFETLYRNCNVRGVQHRQEKGGWNGNHWQVNWGKHQPARFRFSNYIDEDQENTFILPVVVVRDPYTWMQSMCKSPYSARWFHVMCDKNVRNNWRCHCPNLVPNQVELSFFSKPEHEVRKLFREVGLHSSASSAIRKSNFTLDSKAVPIKVRYHSATEYHQSLAHFWKDWYEEYYQATFPRLMVRLEDVVFRPRQVLEEVCNCVGGDLASNLTLAGEAAKDHAKHNTGLVDAMVSHIYLNRTKGMTIGDLQFAKKVLDDSLINDFGYRHPI